MDQTNGTGEGYPLAETQTQLVRELAGAGGSQQTNGTGGGYPVADLQEINSKDPQNVRVKVSFMLPKRLERALGFYSADQDLQKTEVLARALEEFFSNHGCHPEQLPTFKR